MSRRETLAAVGAGILLALASTPQIARADDGLEPLVAVGPGAQVVAVVGIIVALVGLAVERHRARQRAALHNATETAADFNPISIEETNR